MVDGDGGLMRLVGKHAEPRMPTSGGRGTARGDEPSCSARSGTSCRASCGVAWHLPRLARLSAGTAHAPSSVMRTWHLAAIIAVLVGAPACVLPIALLGGIQPYYSRGDFGRSYGDRAHVLSVVGCIEIAPAVREAGETTVVDMRLGNACGDAVTVDLTRLEVTTISEVGEHTARVVSDPNEEIRPLPLPGRGQALEPPALRGSDKALGRVVGLCLDVSAIAPHEGAVASVCFSKEEGRWLGRSGS